MQATKRATRRLSAIVVAAGLPAFVIATAIPAGAQTIVAPNTLAGTPGDIDDSFPFFSSGIRFQEVYDASQFGALTGPQMLTEIAFRPNGAQTSPFSTTISDIQIDFSTTAASSTSLSATFADNVGANDQTVFDGSLTLSSAGAPATGVSPFDILIPLTTPFLYDPTQGNLLMDVRDFSGESDGAFFMDATDDAANGIERVFSDDGSEGETTGTVDDGSINDAGLITQFTFGPVSSATAPEPGSVALICAGMVPAAGLFGASARRRRR